MTDERQSATTPTRLAKARRHAPVAGACVTMILAFVVAAHAAFVNWVMTRDLPALSVPTSTIVVDREGRLLRPFTVADGRWRLAQSLDGIDPDFLNLLTTYEDRRFFDHAGVDWQAMVRAGLQAIWYGRPVSGGSTLTMQVARLLQERRTRSIADKVAQMRLALRLETVLTKAQILELYLLLAPYGGNIEGVRAASLSYFGKEPGHLTPAEAALLVALPQSPARRRPDRFPEEAEAARDRVLWRAVSMGALAEDEARAGMSEPAPKIRRAFQMHTPHLAERLVADKGDGLVIETSIDRRLQRKLEALAVERAARLDPSLSLAIVVADHTSGEILARIGSPDLFSERRAGHVDMSIAIRSPGSTLKPLIYGLAFESRLAHPESLVEDRPTSFAGYTPENFDRGFAGTVTIRTALQRSLNLPAVLVLDAVGPALLAQRMRLIGATPRLPDLAPPGLAFGLGGVGVSLEDLVQLYAGLANGGRAIRLHDQPTTAPAVNRLLAAPAAWHVADILRGIAAPSGAPNEVLPYKTGTSYGYRDAWAIGFDGEHVIGVWIGRPDGQAVPGLSGGTHAAPLLFDAYERLKRQPAPLSTAPPGTMDIVHQDLPEPLKRVRHPVYGTLVADRAPEIAFPPDGARVDLNLAISATTVFNRSLPLALKVRHGAPPFTWLVNGNPVVVADAAREVHWLPDGPGFVAISVIDAGGRSAQARAVLE